ncbi:dipeptide/oligopeptide/nickel ABC transporter permease/ATP-binding protein [uncultured Treponema sp.]|uniref:dipeptide/oligopeptide/nickel ABC transporter permease/ATP-binding protein n=1 Tax=uncultured Treponema sp. TaxID=162155 RepID=UPI0015BC6BC8|nr:dipeptide/oligopeptide/nickel ABC transporter permease/ATP-binding protein [uncultured Treponema sp.]
MKKVLEYIKNRPLALVSLIFILILYLFMIFAEFIAPYSPAKTFEEGTFHPANVELSAKGLAAREFRVLNPSSWQYAKVKGLNHKIRFFVKGEKYRLLGIFPAERHLFGTEPDPLTGDVYPVFLFGADNLGRDMFSRMVYGSRISLTIGFAASAVSLFLAILFGGLAGFFGGIVDWTVMRFSEFFMLIPGLYLILFLRSILNESMDSGQSYMIITLILSLVGWPGTARTLRGMVHSIKREDFVQNARLEKILSIIIILKYIIPQISSLLIVSTTLAVPGFIMSETTLSYLGLGIADPAVSWGSMINREISTLSNLKNFPWLLFPVFLLLAVTLAFNFFGDALRDYFDPYSVVFKRRKKRGEKKSGLCAGGKGTVSDGKNVGVEAEGEGCTGEACGTDGKILLSVRNLHVEFDVHRGKENIRVQSVRGISFNVKRGEILGIVGESGSGKSVSTTAIAGLLPANASVSGQIFYDLGDDEEFFRKTGLVPENSENSKDGAKTGRFLELTALNSRQLRFIRGRKIGMIFQESSRAFDPLQNIGSVFFETLRNSDPKITREEADDKACALLAETGITDARNRLKNFPHQFSGGQLQRIGIALALAQNCELLIADEPTTALDVTIQAQIEELLRTLNRTRGLSIIFISHNIELVSRLSHRMLVMYGGKIMERGESKTLYSSPKHPYTKALLASTPRFGMHYSRQRLLSIPGRVSDPSRPETGCPFAPRCSLATEQCRQEEKDCYAVLQGEN